MMKKVILTSFSMVLFLAGAAWVYKPDKNRTINLSGQDPDHSAVAIHVRQLPVPADMGANAPPAEILNPIAFSKDKNQIEHFSCVVKNNTNKNITAITLSLTTILGEEGKETFDTNLLTTDTLVHPDIKEERGLKDIEPSSGHLMQLPGAISFKEGAFIKSVKIEIRCLVFADNTSLGYDPNGAAATKIRHIREGAAKYKEWLKKTQGSDLRHSTNDKLIQQINSNMLPEDELPDKHFEEGANIYRRWLLRIYNAKGRGTAATYINN